MSDFPKTMRIVSKVEGVMSYNLTLGAVLVGRLVGYDRIDPTDAYRPALVFGVTEEEYQALVELLSPEGFTLADYGY